MELWERKISVHWARGLDSFSHFYLFMQVNHVFLIHLMDMLAREGVCV